MNGEARDVRQQIGCARVCWNRCRGLFADAYFASKQICQHSGGSVGGTSQLILDPQIHIVIAMANNLSEAHCKREEVEGIAEKFESQGK